MNRKTNWFDVAKGITNVSQFAFMIIGPLLLCIFVAMFIKDKFDMGDWIVAVGIVVGLLSSIVGTIDYIKKYLNSISSDKEKLNDKNNFR